MGLDDVNICGGGGGEGGFDAGSGVRGGGGAFFSCCTWWGGCKERALEGQHHLPGAARMPSSPSCHPTAYELAAKCVLC